MAEGFTALRSVAGAYDERRSSADESDLVCAEASPAKVLPAEPPALNPAMLGEWPMFGQVDDIRPGLAAAIAAGEPAVLATLGAADGGAPFGLGAQMLFTPSRTVGFLSGGCIEADVALHAEQVMADGAPQRLIYGRGGPPDLPLPCGGRLAILLERLAADDPAAGRLITLGHTRRPALWLSDGRARLCLAQDDDPMPAAFGVLAAVGGAAAMDEDALHLVRRYSPAQRLIVIGGDPIALAIAEQGLRMAWETTLARPGGPAAPPPIPGLHYVRGEVGSDLAALRADPWTALVVATHDAGTDLDAARAAIRSEAGYIGLLGSHRRWPNDLARLGVSQATLATGRIHAPVGLAIGARGPFEIAVAVTAEIVAHRHARNTPRTAEEAGRPAP